MLGEGKSPNNVSASGVGVAGDRLVPLFYLFEQLALRHLDSLGVARRNFSLCLRLLRLGLGLRNGSLRFGCEEVVVTQTFLVPRGYGFAHPRYIRVAFDPRCCAPCLQLEGYLRFHLL